jgi:exonuclease SbcC
MRLRRLELRNYRRFRRADIEFPDGLVGILGPNGVGKTTLVEAVAWALYGNEQTIVREGKDGVRSAAAMGGEDCSALLEFSLGPDRYRLQRTLKGKDNRSDAVLSVNGSLVARGDGAVTEAIQARLGMDHRAFFISVFARQKDLNALSVLRPAERKKLVLRMLGIDSLDDAISQISLDARSAKEAADNLSRQLVSDAGDRRAILSERIGILRKDEEGHIAMEMEAGAQLPGLREQVEMARSREIEKESRHRRWSELRKEAAETQAELRPLSSSVSSMDEEVRELRRREIELPALQLKARELERLERERGELEAAGAQSRQWDQARGVLEDREKESESARRAVEIATMELAMELEEQMAAAPLHPSEEDIAGREAGARASIERSEASLKELRSNEKVLAEMEAEAAPLRRSLQADREEIARLDKSSRELPDLERAAVGIDALQAEKEELEAAQLKLAARHQSESEVQAREEELRSADGSLRKAEEELGQQPDRFRRLPSVEGFINENAENAAAARRASAIHAEKARELGSRLDADSKHVEVLRGLGPESECPTCLRRLGDHQPFLVGKMEEDVAAMRKARAEEEAAAAAAEEEAERFLRMRKLSEERRADMLREKEAWAVKEQKAIAAREARQRCAASLEAARGKLSLLPGADFDPGRLAEVKEELSRGRKRQEALVQMRTTLARLPELEGRVAATGARIAELERAQPAVRERIALLANAEMDDKEARRSLEEARKAREDHRVRTTREAERLKRLEEAKRTRERIAQDAEGAVRVSRERLDALPHPEFDAARLEEASRTLPHLKKSVEGLTALLADLGRMPQLEARLEREKDAQCRLRSKLAAAERAMESLDGSEKEWREALSDAEEARRRVEAALACSREAGQMAAAKAEQRRDLEAQLMELDGVKRNEQSERARAEELLHLTDALKAFRVDLTSRIVPMLSETASRLMAELTGQRYARLQLNEDYEMSIIDGGQAHPLARFSGGETDVASLCLRLAISRVIAERSGGGVNFLVLDEVFGSQDQERKKSILQLLERLRGQFPQILLITHIDDIKDMLGAVITVSEEGEGSAVRVV